MTGLDVKPEYRIYEMPLAKIKVDPSQPRKYFNEQDLRELADSIKEQGLLHPIMVRKNGDGTFLLVQGERRFRAHEIRDDLLKAFKEIIENGEFSKLLDKVWAEVQNNGHNDADADKEGEDHD